MELKAFILESLLQITEAISTAKNKLGTVRGSDGTSREKIAGTQEEKNIHFEVSLIVSKGKNNSISGEAASGFLLDVTGLRGKANGSLNSHESTSLVQKISFDVPYRPKAL